jgi:hypothetical protein
MGVSEDALRQRWCALVARLRERQREREDRPRAV